MIKVAIVEDHKEYGNVLSDIIKTTSNYSVTKLFNSAEGALKELIEGPVDIVIVDISLPNMSGIELISQLKPILPNTQYLICSTHQDNESVFQSLKAGASGYILKDSTTDEIINALDDLTKGGAPMSPYIAKKVISTFYEPVKPSAHNLTAREKDIVDLLAQGLNATDISKKLFISAETVKTHIRNVYSKLQVNNRVAAINKLKEL